MAPSAENPGTRVLPRIRGARIPTARETDPCVLEMRRVRRPEFPWRAPEFQPAPTEASVSRARQAVRATRRLSPPAPRCALVEQKSHSRWRSLDWIRNHLEKRLSHDEVRTTKNMEARDRPRNNRRNDPTLYCRRRQSIQPLFAGQFRAFHAISSGAFGAIQRRVHDAQQFVDVVLAGAVCHQNTKACRDGNFALGSSHWCGCYRLAHSLRQPQDTFVGRSWEYHQKLFAAVAPHAIIGTRAFGHASRYFLQHDVSRHMAVFVVDGLEVINVREDNSNELVFTMGARQFTDQKFEGRAAARHTGQYIMRRLEMERVSRGDQLVLHFQNALAHLQTRAQF